MPTLVCPICQHRVNYARREEVPFRPFCSKRCQLVDLGRWLDERYRVPGPPVDPADAEAPHTPWSPSAQNPSEDEPT